MNLKKHILNRIEFAVFISAISFLNVLPYRYGKEIVIFVFDLFGYRLGIRRRIAEQQLNDVLPNLQATEKQKIIRNVYRNMALNVVDVYLTSDERLYANSRFENTEFVEEALLLKKGVLLITGHFGNWEAPCRVLPMAGYGLAMITKKQRNKFFDAYTNAIRERQGGTIIDMKNALKGVLLHTKQNKIIGILIDQNAGKRGVLADFMGKPASNWKGTAKIALRFQIPIVPGFVIRNSDDSLTFRYEKMIDSIGLEDSDDNIMVLIRLMNKSLEDKIRQYPEQWFWVHKRWKGAKHFE